MSRWVEDDDERFEAGYTPEPNSGCFLWIKSVSGYGGRGYGQIYYRGKPEHAHRVSWLRHRGSIPPGLHVLHKCDIPSCVNPEHLFLGTSADNLGDMFEKGRNRTNPRVGEANGWSKLTEDIVKEIRNSPLSQRALAAKLGLNKETIGRVRRRESWKHV